MKRLLLSTVAALALSFSAHADADSPDNVTKVRVFAVQQNVCSLDPHLNPNGYPNQHRMDDLGPVTVDFDHVAMLAYHFDPSAGQNPEQYTSILLKTAVNGLFAFETPRRSSCMPMVSLDGQPILGMSAPVWLEAGTYKLSIQHDDCDEAPLTIVGDIRLPGDAESWALFASGIR